MMNPPIVDMRHLTAEDPAAEAASPGLFDKLVDGLKNLPQTSADEAAEDLLARADSYAESQPSFAEDLRAAVA